jgi:hypothetical protein
MHYVLRCRNLLIIFGIRKNCHSNGKNILFYMFIKKDDKTDRNNYGGISLSQSRTYKILSNIFISRLTPYVEETAGDHQCGFRPNRSNIDQIFCMRQVVKLRWESNGTIYR